MIKIYVDQGHNPRGFNTGAEGNGFYEQDITYEIGKRLESLLSQDPNFEVRLSRPDEDTVLGTNNSTSLVARVNEANSWGADIFLSLHTNAAENTNASGSEALIYSRASRVALGLAEDILEQLNLVTGLRNRGVVERPGLYVLKRTAMPAVLVEMGFISNRYDAELMAYSPGLFAEGIYRGILKYYDLD
ncbi:MAG: N-acetylmuramoyl-L-alanine amidase [Clostridia bacterium]|nr:N-acetylmuramoyl-L-alanine amidase [Clostridia bacterium]